MISIHGLRNRVWVLWLLSVAWLLALPGGAWAGEAKPTAAPVDVDARAASTGEKKSDSDKAPVAAAAKEDADWSAPTLPPTESELARGLPILAIEVSGNERVSAREILTYLREKKGDAFDPGVLERDVRELWASGYFDDIVVDMSRSDEGVRLRFLVRERANVVKVHFDGNEHIDDDDLKDIVEVEADSVLSYPAIRRSVQAIRDKYAEEGYFLAEVRPEVLAVPGNQVKVIFHIVEHDPVTVRRVTIIGNEHISDQDIRDIMYTGKGGIFSFGSGGPFRQDAFERDILMLNALYYDRGFLSVRIAAPRVELTPDRRGINLTITVHEGPQYRIRRLRVYEVGEDGREVEPLEGRRALREMVHAKPGDVFKRSELAADLQKVRTLYRDAGYASVQADPETRLDPQHKLVDIVVPIRRGPKVKISRIVIRGNTKTRDKVIRREMEVDEGDWFSETKLEESRRRIISLGYFERVDLSTEQGEDPTRIKVNIEVVERPTGTFQVGAGFSSIESFIATAQVQQANLFGTGQSLMLQAQVSGLRQLINVRFFEPYFFDTDFSFAVNLFDQLRIYNDFSQTSLGGSATFGYAIVRPHTFVSLTYTGQKDRVSTVTRSTFLGTASAVSVFRRLPLANLFRDGITSSLRPAITYDTRDNRLFPTSGMYLRASTEWASPMLGSDNEFIRYSGVSRFYYPIGGGLVAKFNASVGYVTSPNPKGVPIFARYFLGGIFDLRGFRLRTVGPRLPLASSLDPNAPAIWHGANIGGNLMYYQNLELEIPIIEKVGLRGVVFTDAGNAWNTEHLYCRAARGQNEAGRRSLEELGVYAVTDPCFSLASLGRLRTSWGFGLRWFSPMGPLRFEWGFPFKPLPYEEHSVFEFTIGNMF